MTCAPARDIWADISAITILFFGQNINGNLTLGENIADNGGIMTSYQAYRAFVGSKPQQYLPRLKYSPDQIFFIAQAQTLCTIYSSRPSVINGILRENVHSPAPYRVIGPMSNFDVFSNVFQCQSGSKMNPQNKCIIW